MMARASKQRETSVQQPVDPERGAPCHVIQILRHTHHISNSHIHLRLIHASNALSMCAVEVNIATLGSCGYR